MTQTTDTAPASQPGPTPLRTYKAPDDVYDRAMARARREGARDGLSGVIRRALERYADGEDI